MHKLNVEAEINKLQDSIKMQQNRKISDSEKSTRKNIESVMIKRDLSDMNRVHFNVSCDVCQAVPLVGIRYKSISNKDFDLCEKCFFEYPNHKEAFIALRESESAETNHLVMLAREQKIPNYRSEQLTHQFLHRFENDFRDLGGVIH